MQTPGTRTQRPHPHTRASAWIKTEAIRSCSQERTGAEIPQSPAHVPLNWKRAAPSALAQTHGSAGPCQHALLCGPKASESLPAWLEVWAALQSIRITPGFACHSSRVQSRVTAGVWSSSTRGRAVLPCHWRSPECAGRWQHPGWGCWEERLRPSSPPTNPSLASSHPVLADGDFPFSVVGFFFRKALAYLKHMVPQQAAWREWRETCWNWGAGSAVAGDGGVGAQGGAPNPARYPRNSALTALGFGRSSYPLDRFPLAGLPRGQDSAPCFLLGAAGTGGS